MISNQNELNIGEDDQDEGDILIDQDNDINELNDDLSENSNNVAQTNKNLASTNSPDIVSPSNNSSNNEDNIVDDNLEDGDEYNDGNNGGSLLSSLPKCKKGCILCLSETSLHTKYFQCDLCKRVHKSDGERPWWCGNTSHNYLICNKCYFNPPTGRAKSELIITSQQKENFNDRYKSRFSIETGKGATKPNSSEGKTEGNENMGRIDEAKIQEGNHNKGNEGSVNAKTQKDELNERNEVSINMNSSRRIDKEMNEIYELESEALSSSRRIDKNDINELEVDDTESENSPKRIISTNSIKKCNSISRDNKERENRFNRNDANETKNQPEQENLDFRNRGDEDIKWDNSPKQYEKTHLKTNEQKQNNKSKTINQNQNSQSYSNYFQNHHWTLFEHFLFYLVLIVYHSGFDLLSLIYCFVFAHLF